MRGTGSLRWPNDPVRWLRQRSKVNHATSQVQVAREGLGAIAQPWLAWESPATETLTAAGDSPQAKFVQIQRGSPGVDALEDEDGIFGYIVLRNVGSGVGLLHLSESWVLGHDGTNYAELRPYVTLVTDNPVVQQGHLVLLQFDIPRASAAWTALSLDRFVARHGTCGDFECVVTFTDAMERSPTRAEFFIRRDEDIAAWSVERIYYYVGEATDPIKVFLA